MWAIMDVFCCCALVQLCGGSFSLSLKRRLPNFDFFCNYINFLQFLRFRQVYSSEIVIPLL